MLTTALGEQAVAEVEEVLFDYEAKLEADRASPANDKLCELLGVVEVSGKALHEALLELGVGRARQELAPFHRAVIGKNAGILTAADLAGARTMLNVVASFVEAAEACNRRVSAKERHYPRHFRLWLLSRLEPVWAKYTGTALWERRVNRVENVPGSINQAEFLFRIISEYDRSFTEGRADGLLRDYKNFCREHAAGEGPVPPSKLPGA